MGAALPIAAIAMTAASSIMGGIQQAGNLRAEAKQDAENGRLSLKSGEQEAMDTLREARFQQGGAAAQMASSGLLFGGSVSTVLADSARSAELDIDRIREKAAGEANNYYASAAQKRKGAKNAILGGIFNAVASTVQGASGLQNQGKVMAQARAERSSTLGAAG
ncbi:hypothetical protein [Novosphingobium clariflavum]|uniref:Uncharacterized protein n=1 Tax=Novosphingobium clariflavum TaxID=2029884 RepID=A0ABV6S314_9SPHN|nr:hypothetical protein [Novosphingobium clariflavum]